MITPNAKYYALEVIFPDRQWEVWTSRLLLLVGSALFLAGVVFFFAYNWNSIEPFWKLTIVESGIILGIAGAMYFSLSTLPGKLSALSAGLLVGVFLAVFGQIYQTGANAYSLFVPWMLMILPWVFLAKFSAFWFLWFVVSQLALSTYWLQGVLPGSNYTFLLFSLSALSGCIFIALHEWTFKNESGFHDYKWVRILTSLYVLWMILYPLIFTIFEFNAYNIGTLTGAILALGIFAAFYYLFRWKLVDKTSLTFTLAAILFAAGSLVTKLLMEIFQNETSGFFLLMAIIYLGLTGAGITHLRSVYKTMGGADGS